MGDAGNGLTTLTAQIVTAFVGGQTISAYTVPALIRQVHDTLRDLTLTADTPGLESANGTAPFVAATQSVFPDRVICLFCGFSAKMLKQHLLKSHDLTPEAYREKWQLPASYPLVAPDHSANRSRIAKEQGLGKGTVHSRQRRR